jgi:hypothetical protein
LPSIQTSVYVELHSQPASQTGRQAGRRKVGRLRNKDLFG